MSTSRPIAWSFHTPRLQVAPYHPHDAEAYVKIVTENRAHLRPTMPFACVEPHIDTYVRWFSGFQRSCFEGDYAMSIRTHAGQIVGGGGVHPSVGALGREAGYWIVKEACGQGYAGEALAAFCVLALFGQEGIDRVELRIEPQNHASIRVAEKAGFVREALLRRRLDFPEGPPRDVVIYTLFREMWSQCPLAEVPVRSFDPAGRPLKLEG